MNHLRRLGSRFSIPIQPDEERFTGRECPAPECESYFKIEFGTGLKGEGLPCHCPYCGHTAPHDQFWTKEQLEYAKSVAMRKITDAFHRDLKGMEFSHRPRGGLGIGISLKVKTGPSTPIRHYREKRLETEIVCKSCTLHYSVYGVFAFCPDCGQHNSVQILEKNLEVVGKMLALAAEADRELAGRLVENALEDCVSAFDGFGRELCRVHADKAKKPEKAVKLSFQNLEGARKNVLDFFGLDLADSVSPQEWTAGTRGFQKRHLLAHCMGVVDNDYVSKTSDRTVVVGRKVAVTPDDVEAVAKIVHDMGTWLAARFDERGGA